MRRRRVSFLALACLFLLCWGVLCPARVVYDIEISAANKPSFDAFADSLFFTLDGVEWCATCVFSKDNSGERWKWTAGGLYIGTNGRPISSADITTSGLPDLQIVEIIVTANVYNSTNARLSVSVGGVPFLCDGEESVNVEYLPLSPGAYTFEYPAGATGEIVIHYDVDDSAVYFCGVKISDAAPLLDPALSYSSSLVALDTDDLGGAVVLPTLSYSDSFTGTIAYASSDSSVATVSAAGEVSLVGGVGTATITASVAEDETYMSSQASYDIVVKEPHTFDFTIHTFGLPLLTDETFLSEDATLAGRAGVSALLTAAYRLYSADGVRLQLGSGGEMALTVDDDDVDILQIDFLGPLEDSNLSQLSCADGTLSVAAYGATWTGCARSVTFRAADIVQIETIDVVVGSTALGTGSLVIAAADGYATLFLGEAFVMPAELVGTTVPGVDGDQLLLPWEYAAGDTIPAATALLLYGVPATYTYVLVSSPLAAPTDNLLYGSLSDTQTSVAGNTDDYLFYMLTYDAAGKNMGFYWGADAGAPFTSAANKAWLALPRALGITTSPFLLSGAGVNGLRAAPSAASASSTEIYSLQGVRLPAAPQKGVYILGGKKFVGR